MRRDMRLKIAARAALYTAIREDQVPAGIEWRRAPGGKNAVNYYYSFGKTYKKVVDTVTGAAVYYKLIDEGTPMSANVDAEPKRAGQVRYRVGAHCWFVDTDSRWYLCEVISRAAFRMTIRPVTGQDAEHVVPWPYGGDLEFSGKVGSRLYQRLRPLKDRKP